MNTTITTRNPYSGEVLAIYEIMSEDEVLRKIQAAHLSFGYWKTKSVNERTGFVNRLADYLHEHKQELARTITLEMGKPISESVLEIEKCLWICRYYAENSSQFLREKKIPTDAAESYVSYDPLGVIFGIMPWNDPFSQVIRFAVPTLLAGNTVLLKHASNVTGCALLLQDAFLKAGFPENVFQTLVIQTGMIPSIIQNQHIQGVSFTGSTQVGREIAKISGENLKKCVLELGGNNACIILEDAAIEKHIKAIVHSRMACMGQNCIAAKRFIVVEKIYDRFLDKFLEETKTLRVGNPLDPDTQIGPLAKESIAREVEHQVKKSIEMGAVQVYGTGRGGNYLYPTVLTGVKPGMPAFDNEIFGPVASIIKVRDFEEALKTAANSSFGLGTMIFTENVERAKKHVEEIEDGSYFINAITKSDPRLPFGGTKDSGIGNELSEEGILEFVNKKTVYIK